jgi:hypothetical protein
VGAAFQGNKGVSMNDTLANITSNLNNVTPTTTFGGNETLSQAASSAGNFGLDKLLNMQWTEGVAVWLNATFNTSAFSGSVIAALLPIVTILFLYWKWNSIVQFIQTAGQVILVLLIFFLLMKAFGIL